MSDLRPEFRPLAFPRSVEPQAPSGLTPPAMSPGAAVHRDHVAYSTVPLGPEHHEAHRGGEEDCEADLCDEPYGDHDPIDSHDAVSIAGRIGAASGEPTPGELVEMLLRLGQRLRGHLDTRFGTFGLSDARFAALSVIREAAPAGCTQAHLATKLGQCESSISTLVERMRSSRLLYRLRAKADRRKRVLMLTDDGRQLFDQGLAARDREAESLFSRMTAEEQQQLSGLLGRLFSTLDRIGETSDRSIEREAA